MAPASRLRQAGWAVVLAACVGLLLALTFHVNAVKSQVRLTERHIIAAERAKMMLETEFQTRASQQQLSDWNAVEFGYAAPRADQYLENEIQLAVLGTPRGFGAPQPIRVAMSRPVAEVEQPGVLDGWLDDEPETPAETRTAAATPDLGEAVGASLAQRLAQPTASVIAVAEVAQ